MSTTHPEYHTTETLDALAAYTEDGDIYAENMDRLALKLKTAVKYLPTPEISRDTSVEMGLIFFGTTVGPIQEVLDSLSKQGINFNI